MFSPIGAIPLLDILSSEAEKSANSSSFVLQWLYQQAVDMAVMGIKPDPLVADHMFHCAEYMRQSVMCYADPTLERRYEGILGPFSANNTHVCGDWFKLMDWADEHIYTGPIINPDGPLPP